MQQGVCLKQVIPSKTFVFNDNIKESLTHSNLRNALSYRFEQNFISQDIKVQIICIPAYDLEEGASEGQLLDGVAYIKVSDSDLRAQQSGKRSVILNDKYRLKGCGNLDQGFPLEPIVQEIPGYFEIRGCQFEHTVKRELYITHKVEQILSNFGIKGGNHSLGYWQYGDIGELTNELELVPKYCSVYETLGDSRLGTHLIQGFRLIVEPLIKDYTFEQLSNLVHPTRVKQYDREKPLNQWHLTGTRYQERDFDLMTVSSKNIKQQLQRDTLFDWDQEVNINSISNFTGDLQQLFRIYERIGFELGRIKRIFIDNDLNWGYFRDHSQYQYHCNAHLDNFIILINQDQNLLAPLDFDIAFFKSEFINIEYDYSAHFQNIVKGTHTRPEPNPNYGKFDESLWNWQLEMEREALELAIAGTDMIMGSNMHVNKIENPIADIFDVLFRDQMRIGYLNGMMLRDDTSEYNGDRTLIKRALDLTTSIIA